MMSRIFPIGFFLVAILSGCDRSPYPHYKKIGEDLHLRLYMLGEGDRLARDGDSVLMRLRISEVEAAPGSLFSTDQWYAVADLRESAFDELLIRMHEGDSMSLITSPALLPWSTLIAEDTLQLTKYGALRTEVSMLSIRTAAMMEAEAERLRREDPQAYEQKLTFEFIDRLGTNWLQWGTSDLHYAIQGIAMDTNAVKPGEIVTISYTGKLVEDGSVFDSSERNGGPLTFRFGDKGQVINGLEIAIKLLREGQEGEFFLPSDHAFGARGVEGMIAPYTPVLYTVRLESVERPGKMM